MRKVSILAISILLTCLKTAGLSYEVPRDDSRAKFLYVFGDEGSPDFGADSVDNTQELFIDIPAGEFQPLSIGIYDPDTGGFHDLKPKTGVEWGTRVKFLVYGAGDKILGERVFGSSPEYDRKVFSFGPYKKESGEEVGDFYRFRLVASALEGEDQNLFSVRISPETAQTFSTKISFRLLPKSKEVMSFYPEIPAGVARIVAENYDMDPDGGESLIIDSFSGRNFKIKNSDTAEWAQTQVDIGVSGIPRRPIYQVTKKVQRYANAALRVRDDRGNLLPIYFSRGRSPVVVREQPVRKEPELTCNRFTFDGRKSYDPNGDKLSYLWDFGDGAQSSEPVIMHLYEEPGEYKVALTVKNTSGLLCDSSTSTRIVEVNAPPSAVIQFCRRGVHGRDGKFRRFRYGSSRRPSYILLGFW